MLPWNYGFEWNTGHIVFLGAFYAVLAAVAATLVAAARRGWKAISAHRADEIAWHADFHELPPRDRACRHELTGEFRQRECPRGFDCRQCATHAGLLARHPLEAVESPAEELFGMTFPLDRYYHRGHTWVRPEVDGTATVGLDELGTRLLGTPDGIQLPAPGAFLTVNGTAFRLRRRGTAVRVLSPVDGQVLATGGPDAGWYLKIRPTPANGAPFGHLLRGAEIRPFLIREMERLQFALGGRAGAATLADGGVLVSDPAAHCSSAEWDEVCGEIFLEP